jgi:SAM-dependent methyltransferase
MSGSWTPNRIAWSLRKVSLPIKASDLVLDVGSGSNPHPAADVLLERFLDPRHRWSPMVIDRPTVLANACKMPFRDKAFDYVIAFHVLEHVDDPESFLLELQRVGKAGYIETPNALFERLVPYDIHLLEIMNIEETLLIHKKSSARPDPFLNELDLTKHSTRWHSLFYGNPKLFHVRYFWQDKISYKMVNPETSLNWFVDPSFETSSHAEVSEKPMSNGVRSLGLSLLRKYYKFRKRRALNLNEILCCPDCHKSLVQEPSAFVCTECQMSYPRVPVPDFNNSFAVTRKVQMAVSAC